MEGYPQNSSTVSGTIGAWDISFYRMNDCNRKLDFDVLSASIVSFALFVKQENLRKEARYLYVKKEANAEESA